MSTAMSTALAKAGVRKSKTVRVGESKPTKPRAPRASRKDKIDSMIADFLHRHTH